MYLRTPKIKTVQIVQKRDKRRYDAIFFCTVFICDLVQSVQRLGTKFLSYLQVA